MQDINHSTEELPAGDFFFYSRSRKTVNTRENFWNVYCFATIQMQDETAKDNGQTAAGSVTTWYEKISWPFFYEKSSIFPLYFSEKAIFYHKPTLVTWFRLFKTQTTELTWK